MAINLNNAPFNYLPFSMVGFLIYAFDGGNSRFNGAWPQEAPVKLQTLTEGYGWAYGPFAYGDLILSQSAPANFWADVDRDQDVDIFDIQLVAACWGNNLYDNNYHPEYDVNNDGSIDIFDLQLVASWWNKPIPTLKMLKELTVVTDKSVRLKICRKTPEAYELLVVNAADLAAFQMEFSSVEDVKLRQTVLGDFLGGTGNTVIALPPHYSSDNKKVSIGAFSYGVNLGASGAGKLAEIIFEKSTSAVVTNIKCADQSGNALAVVMEKQDPVIAAYGSSQFALLPNFPNPFNATTTIEFCLPGPEYVSVKIFSVLGEQVDVLAQEHLESGIHKVVWNAGDHGNGIYYILLETETERKWRKAVLIK
jgi:hypothetical protein